MAILWKGRNNWGGGLEGEGSAPPSQKKNPTWEGSVPNPPSPPSPIYSPGAAASGSAL